VEKYRTIIKSLPFLFYEVYIVVGLLLVADSIEAPVVLLESLLFLSGYVFLLDLLEET
jgi:hypothetical protein